MSFDLSQGTITEPDFPEDVQELDNGNYMYETEYSKIKVEMRLLTGRDENTIFKALKSSDDAAMSTQMKLFVVGVNGHSHPNIIQHFVNNIPAFEARDLRKAFNSLTAMVEVKENYTCNSCGYEQEMEVPFNADFFWPDR